MENMLWYKSPAKEWMEGLPIGNGRLAAMVWGDKEIDYICLNHEWLWRGVNRYRDSEVNAEHLDDVRDALKENDFLNATTLANKYFGGAGGVSGKKGRVDAYQPAGDLFVKVHDTKEYTRRELDIQKAVVTTYRKTNKASVISKVIAHPDYNLIVGNWCSDDGEFSANLVYKRVEDLGVKESCVYTNSGIEYLCAFDKGTSYKTVIKIESDGKISYDNQGIDITNATYIRAYINIGTSVKGIQEELAMYEVPDISWDELFESHSKKFMKVLTRLNLDIELDISSLPTDERIELIRKGEEDIALILLYFNYGKYLLVSSSIVGELPANLQGKWNDSIDPPWDSDYHFDINLQMNYWMTESTNMPECAQALIGYLERYIPHAKKTAKDLYGCRGIYLPIQSDAWGRSTPEANGWAVWIGAAPWMAQHFWWHYEYSGNIDFLGDHAYPYFKEVAEFYEDYLVADENNQFQIMPSQSPENRFAGTGDWPVSIGISSAMDVQLAYDALGYAIKASKILNIDSKNRKVWQQMQDNLPPFKIGSDGRLLEWEIQREEVEPGHRHLSHLYGLYPSDIFNPIDRPGEYEASIKSLDYRLKSGGGHTGWSRAWVACLCARIGRRQDVWTHLYALVTDFATISLLDLHPPRIFQIDGNLGAVEAIMQTLVQCWGGKVHLLRALPSQWQTGSIQGIKLKGGHTISFSWRNSILEKISITLGYSENIVLSGLANQFNLPDGVLIDDEDICIKGDINTTYTLNKK